jgi:endonuclease YncB( thermonuclease family)
MYILVAALLIMSACTMTPSSPAGGTGGTGGTGGVPAGDAAQVMRVIDGDTIDVEIGGVGFRVRYIGMNTPERDEVCYQPATDANTALLSGKTITLVKDTSETDTFGRLLRYVYAGDTFVNAELVRNGWAENAEYPPDTTHAAEFRMLEAQAAAANVGCHPSRIFDDGNETR